MKKSAYFVLIVLLIIVFVPNAKALTVVGWVNPVFNPGSYTQGIATYTFNVNGNTGDYLTYFKLTFLPPPDAFSAFSLVPGSYPTSPFAMYKSGNYIQWATFFNTVPLIYAGHSFTFDVQFTLTTGYNDPNYNNVWGPGNTAWMQDFSGVYYDSGSSNYDAYGGSTALAPEPGSVILLGFGFIMIGILGKVRRRLLR